MSDDQICNAADDILDILRELRGPKDAAMALLVAHVRMTLEAGLPNAEIDGMLTEYASKFRTSFRIDVSTPGES